MSWSLGLILLAVPLPAQVTARPWGLIGIQLTGIQPGTGLTAGQLSPDGQIYITGGNTDFPWPAPTKILGDVSLDSTFVLKTDPSGKTLFEVQIGGSYAIGAPVFDSAGNAYVLGNAAERGFATTPGAYQPSATADGSPFACKLSATDGSPVYCTFLPGDVLSQAATDSAGNLYFVGRLGASASTTPGALSQGSRSISVGKLDPPLVKEFMRHRSSI